MLYNKLKRMQAGVVPILAATQINAREHAQKVCRVESAAGIAITLPVPTGSGDTYTFDINTTVTSGATTIKAPNSSVVFDGQAIQLADAGSGLNGWETAADTDTVSLNGSTTGGLRGDLITFIDISPTQYQVLLVGAATGTEATPFSATV